MIKIPSNICFPDRHNHKKSIPKPSESATLDARNLSSPLRSRPSGSNLVSESGIVSHPKNSFSGPTPYKKSSQGLGPAGASALVNRIMTPEMRKKLSLDSNQGTKFSSSGNNTPIVIRKVYSRHLNKRSTSHSPSRCELDDLIHSANSSQMHIRRAISRSRDRSLDKSEQKRLPEMRNHSNRLLNNNLKSSTSVPTSQRTSYMQADMNVNLRSKSSPTENDMNNRPFVSEIPPGKVGGETYPTTNNNTSSTTSP